MIIIIQPLKENIGKLKTLFRFSMKNPVIFLSVGKIDDLYFTSVDIFDVCQNLGARIEGELTNFRF